MASGLARFAERAKTVPSKERARQSDWGEGGWRPALQVQLNTTDVACSSPRKPDHRALEQTCSRRKIIRDRQVARISRVSGEVPRLTTPARSCSERSGRVIYFLRRFEGGGM